MRWEHGRRSENVEDRRGMRVSGKGLAGGIRTIILALATAAGVGVDRLQQQAHGVVVPKSLTHGLSAQRVRWFSREMHGSDPGQCDTFKAARP